MGYILNEYFKVKDKVFSLATGYDQVSRNDTFNGKLIYIGLVEKALVILGDKINRIKRL